MNLKMQDIEYLMESDEEAYRLDIKTDREVVEKQALWAGIGPGMLVVDLGCGSGKTTSILHRLVQPEGRATGVDYSVKRIEFARKLYQNDGVEFICMDIRNPLEKLGMFDFIWVRFVLEYYLSNSFDIVKNVSKILKPGGILCLIDLDYNCLSHYDIPLKLKRTLFYIMKYLEEKANFDPYLGRKLYSFLYDLGYQDIDVNVAAHHLIFGELKHNDAFNWFKKLEVVSRKINFLFEEYQGGYEEFIEEFNRFFNDPRRFTYTPVILCKGHKPIT